MKISRLKKGDEAKVQELSKLFKKVFEMESSEPPSISHCAKILNSESNFFVVAEINETVVGGLSAYVLPSIHGHSECYVFDLAVVFFMNCLEMVLKLRKKKPLPIIYDEIQLDVGYRIDLFVEDSVIVKLKTVENFSENHIAQVLNYLKHSGCRVGLLLNFNCKSLKNGIKRIAL